MSLLVASVNNNGIGVRLYYTLDKGSTWTLLDSNTFPTGDGGFFSSGDGSLVIIAARNSSTYGSYFGKWSP